MQCMHSQERYVSHPRRTCCFMGKQIKSLTLLFKTGRILRNHWKRRGFIWEWGNCWITNLNERLNNSLLCQLTTISIEGSKKFILNLDNNPDMVTNILPGWDKCSEMCWNVSEFLSGQQIWIWAVSLEAYINNWIHVYALTEKKWWRRSNFW